MGTAGILSRQEILALLDANPPLIRGFADLDAQLQPNGFDLTLAEVRSYAGRGTISRQNAGRQLAEIDILDHDAEGFVELAPGAYHVTYAETVALPADIMALGRPRSSLTRCGATIHTAVWDAGYEGRSTSLLVVSNPYGFRVQLGARVAQLVFATLTSAADQIYEGIYQRENLRSGSE